MIQSLKSLLKQFASLVKRSKSQNLEGAPASANTTPEVISRFVQSSNQYRKSDVRIRHSAFMPQKHPETGFETSVFRTATLTEEEIWQLGANQLQKDKPIYCRGDIDQDAVKKIGSLNVVEETTNQHHLHSIIIGWPEEKDQRKVLALELEQIAKSYAGPGHS